MSHNGMELASFNGHLEAEDHLRDIGQLVLFAPCQWKEMEYGTLKLYHESISNH